MEPKSNSTPGVRDIWTIPVPCDPNDRAILNARTLRAGQTGFEPDADGKIPLACVVSLSPRQWEHLRWLVQEIGADSDHLLSEWARAGSETPQSLVRYPKPPKPRRQKFLLPPGCNPP